LYGIPPETLTLGVDELERHILCTRVVFLLLQDIISRNGSLRLPAAVLKELFLFFPTLEHEEFYTIPIVYE
jgi:hypothetical protein